jgi:hypothetical protein
MDEAQLSKKWNEEQTVYNLQIPVGARVTIYLPKEMRARVRTVNNSQIVLLEVTKHGRTRRPP